MKQSIYVKFILLYLIAAVLSFIFVTKGTSQMIMDHVTTEKASLLYQEATLLSTDYAEKYYESQTVSKEDAV